MLPITLAPPGTSRFNPTLLDKHCTQNKSRRMEYKGDGMDPARPTV